MDAVREAASGRPRRGGVRRVVRWAVRLSVGGVLLIALVVAFLPTLISTGAGTARIVDTINQQIPGHVEIDDMKLAWLKGQSLQGVRLYDPAGDVVGSIDEVRLEDVGLIALARGTRDLGIIAIEGGAVSLVEDEDGSTNLDRALGTSIFAKPERQPMPPAGPAPPSESDTEPADKPEVRTEPAPRSEPKPDTKDNGPVLPADLRLAFAMRDIKLHVVGPTLPDVLIEVPEATLTADTPASLGFTLDATLAQGKENGQVKIAGTAKDLFDAAGEWSLYDAEFDVEGLVQSVPMSAIDRIASEGEPFLQTVIGPMLDANISMQGPTDALDALVTVTSENLNVRQGLIASAQRINASDESYSTWVFTPETWKMLTGGGEQDEPGPELVEPFVLSFGLRGLDAPRKGQSLDLDATQFLASVSLENGQSVRLAVPEQGEITVQNFTAALGSESAATGVSFTLDADVDAYGNAGELSGVVDVRRGEAGWNELEIESVLRTLPMAVVDALAGQGKRLTTTFGPTVGMNLLAKADGAGGYALTAGFDPGAGSPGVSRLSGTMTGRYSADGAIALKTDTPIRLTMSPEAFDQWMQPVAAAADMGESVGLSLPEAADVEADLDIKFALADGPGLRFDPERTRAVAVIDLPETQLVDEWYHRSFPLRNGTIRIDAPDLRQPITAKIGFETDTPTGETGTLTADARLTGVMLDDGYIQVERGKLECEIELNRVPTVVFDALSRQQGYAVAAFGETVSTNIDLSDWSFGSGGRIEFELNSANNSLASFSGEDKEDYFVPDAPMTMFLNQTPELSNKILRFLNPVLLPAVVSATVPMAVTIDDDTLRLPTRGFDISKLDADITAQMGTLSIVPNVSPVDKILPQLQALGVIEKASIYEARVSPITIRIRNGVIIYEELSFKIDDVELMFGGTISLVDQTVDMGMTLGGREIDRDPLLKRLVGEGIQIGGTVKQPQVNLTSVLNAFSQERLPQTLGGILEGVLKKELGRDEPEAPPVKPVEDGGAQEVPATEEPEPEESLEEAIGGLLGDFLRRELEKAQE